MNEELYNELKEIEDRLFDIMMAIDRHSSSKLTDAWESLYDYLKENKPK